MYACTGGMFQMLVLNLHLLNNIQNISCIAAYRRLVSGDIHRATSKMYDVHPHTYSLCLSEPPHVHVHTYTHQPYSKIYTFFVLHKVEAAESGTNIPSDLPRCLIHHYHNESPSNRIRGGSS